MSNGGFVRLGAMPSRNYFNGIERPESDSTFHCLQCCTFCCGCCAVFILLVSGFLPVYFFVLGDLTQAEVVIREDVVQFNQTVWQARASAVVVGGNLFVSQQIFVGANGDNAEPQEYSKQISLISGVKNAPAWKPILGRVRATSLFHTLAVLAGGACGVLFLLNLVAPRQTFPYRVYTCPLLIATPFLFLLASLPFLFTRRPLDDLPNDPIFAGHVPTQLPLDLSRLDNSLFIQGRGTTPFWVLLATFLSIIAVCMLFQVVFMVPREVGGGANVRDVIDDRRERRGGRSSRRSHRQDNAAANNEVVYSGPPPAVDSPAYTASSGSGKMVEEAPPAYAEDYALQKALDASGPSDKSGDTKRKHRRRRDVSASSSSSSDSSYSDELDNRRGRPAAPASSGPAQPALY